MRRLLATLLAGPLLAVFFIAPAWGDDIVLNAGSGGETLAGDADGGGAIHQQMKVEFGEDNTQTAVSLANPLPVQAHGMAANGAAVSDEPLQIGGEARTTLPTAVDNGDVVRPMLDDDGRLVISPHSQRDLVTQNNITLNSGTTTDTLIAAGGANVFRDLVMLIISNDSTAEVSVAFKDSSGGTTRLTVDLAADGGGAVIPFPVPFQQATANNLWSATLSGAVSSVYITAIAVDRQ